MQQWIVSIRLSHPHRETRLHSFFFAEKWHPGRPKSFEFLLPRDELSLVSKISRLEESRRKVASQRSRRPGRPNPDSLAKCGAKLRTEAQNNDLRRYFV
ncbi:MAG: hypothetical protein NTW07_02465, partial [candidate division Zixibacteria bacterium]|nr:hypothetical protein [candidate division Zixibacteria bacterium]